jgi:hypothetical protein
MRQELVSRSSSRVEVEVEAPGSVRLGAFEAFEAEVEAPAYSV